MIIMIYRSLLSYVCQRRQNHIYVNQRQTYCYGTSEADNDTVECNDTAVKGIDFTVVLTLTLTLIIVYFDNSTTNQTVNVQHLG